MFKFIIYFLLFASCAHAEQLKLWESDDSNTLNLMSQRDILPGWMKIYPGTKWCGDDTIADDYEDLGPEVETDKCCRAHDYCPNVIFAGETKHNLTNTAFHSKVDCQCDIDFHNCLKNVGTETSYAVGIIYFSISGTQCFQENYLIVECTKYSYFPVWKKCLAYELDTSQPKIYQWFDVPNY